MNASNSSDVPWSGNTPTCRRFIISINALMIGLVLLCVVGNAVSFYTWKKVGGRRGFSSSILLLMVLAVSDTLVNVVVVLAVCVPEFITLATDAYNYYTNLLLPFIVKYVWPFASIALFVTTWITTLLCIHRFAVLRFPFSGKTKKLVSTKSTAVQIISIVAAAVLFTISAFLEYDIEITVDDNITYANILLSSLMVDETYNIAFATITYMIVMNIAPLLISIILTCQIIQLLVKARAARANMAVNTADNQERGISITLISVVIIFIICQTPTTVFRVMLAVDAEGSMFCGGKYFFIEDIAICTIALNSSVNVFVYGSCSSEFRKALPNCLKMTCCCKSATNSQQNPQSMSDIQASSVTTLSSQVAYPDTTQL